MFYMKCNLINSQWFSLHTNNSVIKILWAQVVYLNILRTFYHPCCFWLLLKPSCLKAERTLITSWRFTLSILEKAPPEAIIQVWCVKLVGCPDKALWHSYPQLILFNLFSLGKKAGPQERWGATKGKSPSLRRKQVYQNDQKNPLERRKRKRRRKMRRKGVSAQAVTAAATTAGLPKTSSRGKSLKVDTKTRKLKKTERET